MPIWKLYRNVSDEPALSTIKTYRSWKLQWAMNFVIIFLIKECRNWRVMAHLLCCVFSSVNISLKSLTNSWVEGLQQSNVHHTHSPQKDCKLFDSLYKIMCFCKDFGSWCYRPGVTLKNALWLHCKYREADTHETPSSQELFNHKSKDFNCVSFPLLI